MCGRTTNKVFDLSLRQTFIDKRHLLLEQIIPAAAAEAKPRMSEGNKHFERLVSSGNPVGEVIAVDRFLIKVRGLQPCGVFSLIMFEDGSKGFVQDVGTRLCLSALPWAATASASVWWLSYNTPT